MITESEKDIDNSRDAQHDTKTSVRRSLPLTNQKLWVMAKTIVDKQKKVAEVDLAKVDWDLLEDEWFDWLEESLFREVKSGNK